jgi:uncharacterized coiled-coil protein SlyX
MSILVDFKIINLTHNGADSFKENMRKFIHIINDYLQKGYTLHGNTTADGGEPAYQTFSQAVVKYSGTTPVPIITSYKLQWCAYNNNGVDASNKHIFERNIIDEVLNGYTLHGDLMYFHCGSNHMYHCYSQALVKIAKSSVIFAEDLESIRQNVDKHRDSLTDLNQQIANHTKTIAELRLDLDTQEKIICRQKRLIDELFNPVKPATPAVNLSDI